MLKVSKSYWTRSGRKYKILEEKDGVYLAKFQFGAMSNPWTTYDINGKCLDHDCYGDRKDFLDLKIPEEYVPWTQETFSLEATWVKEKESRIGRNGIHVQSFGPNGVYMKDKFVGYQVLLENYLMLDGQPCGKKVE